jgi:hypothetical protein
MAQSSSPPKIVLDNLSQSIIQQRLESVPRKLADRKATLESLFQQVGCEGDRFVEQPVPHSKAPNLVCTLPGEGESEIVVGGHLDSIEVGMGAVDDWSGSVLLPSLYQSLKNVPRHHRFVFVGFAGEEQGLLGSHEFVKKLPPDEIKHIHAMINIECLGLGRPEVWATRASPRLLDHYAILTSVLHMPMIAMNVDRVGDDDSHSFMNAGIPVLPIHSLTTATLPILHHAADKVSAINPDDYYTAYRLISAYLAYLDLAIE